MHVVIEQDGNVHAVDVRQTPDGTFLVTVDGMAAELDVRLLGQGHLSVRLADGSTCRIVVERGSRPDERVVLVDGQRVVTGVNGRRARRETSAGAAGQQRIVAAMPGKVVRVLAEAGQDVVAGQPLVVVEAMKMENELSGTRPGRVIEVLVTEGQSVEAGRLLVVVE